MTDTNQPPQDHKGKIIVGLIIALVVALVVVFWLVRDADQQTVVAPPVQPQPVVTEPEVIIPVEPEVEPELIPEPSDTVELEPEPETPPAPPLPALADSTAPVVAELSEAGVDVAPLKSPQLIRDAVVFIDNLRNGAVIRDKAVIEGPTAQFKVLEQNGKLYIDPRSYDRYNTLVDWFVSLDGVVLTNMMETYEPLIQEALDEIGYPDQYPQQVLLDAIDTLLATPSVGTVIELNDDSVMYRYADPTLEALPDAQKQMLRMGPDNIRRVKLKLESLRTALLAKD